MHFWFVVSYRTVHTGCHSIGRGFNLIIVEENDIYHH